MKVLVVQEINQNSLPLSIILPKVLWESFNLENKTFYEGEIFPDEFLEVINQLHLHGYGFVGVPDESSL